MSSNTLRLNETKLLDGLKVYKDDTSLASIPSNITNGELANLLRDITGAKSIKAVFNEYKDGVFLNKGQGMDQYEYQYKGNKQTIRKVRNGSSSKKTSSKKASSKKASSKKASSKRRSSSSKKKSNKDKKPRRPRSVKPLPNSDDVNASGKARQLTREQEFYNYKTYYENGIRNNTNFRKSSPKDIKIKKELLVDRFKSDLYTFEDQLEVLFDYKHSRGIYTGQEKPKSRGTIRKDLLTKNNPFSKDGKHRRLFEPKDRDDINTYLEDPALYDLNTTWDAGMKRVKKVREKKVGEKKVGEKKVGEKKVREKKVRDKSLKIDEDQFEAFDRRYMSGVNKERNDEKKDTGYRYRDWGTREKVYESRKLAKKLRNNTYTMDDHLYLLFDEHFKRGYFYNSKIVNGNKNSNKIKRDLLSKANKKYTTNNPDWYMQKPGQLDFSNKGVRSYDHGGLNWDDLWN